MSAKAARRLLLFSFAISLLVHFVVVLSVRPPLPNDEVARVTIKPARHVMRIVDETPQPSPPPTPAPKPRSIAQRPRRPVTVHLPVATTHTAGPVVAVRSTAVAVSGTPGAPTPTSRPCNAPAAISTPPNPPEIAPEVRAQMTSGTAQILVHLDAVGNILETSVTASTGNSSLDQVAVSMARSATYLPPRAQCKAIAGDYTFSARFAPW